MELNKYLFCEFKKIPNTNFLNELHEIQAHYRLLPMQTKAPWLPIACKLPYWFFGHYEAVEKDFWNIPEEFVFCVQLSKEDYSIQYDFLKQSMAHVMGQKELPCTPIKAYEDVLLYFKENYADIAKNSEEILSDKDSYLQWLFQQKIEQKLALPLDHIKIYEQESLPAMFTQEEQAAMLPTKDIIFVEAGNIQAKMSLEGAGIPYLELPEDLFKQQKNVETQKLLEVENEGAQTQVLLSYLDCTENLEEQASNPVTVLKNILKEAVYRGVSDVHCVQNGHQGMVYFRQDGMLIPNETFTMGLSFFGRFLSIACQQSGIEPYKRLIPHGGRFTAKFENGDVDVRVSVIPHEGLQSLVMRILDNRKKEILLSELGMSEKEIHLIRMALYKRSGLIIVTGPTGSGKSSSLYAYLEHLVKKTRSSIQTIEDPIERHINGIRQFQVERREDPNVDLPFDRIFRDVLRHDPDIIMVGEVRDSETAKMAVQAANTGHLVLTTLHTNTALGAIQRFLSFGINREQLAEALILLQGQRLVRTYCPHCYKEPIPKEEDIVIRELIATYLNKKEVPSFTRPVGCSVCNNSRYLGRQAIFEILPVTFDLRMAIADGAATETLVKIANTTGYTTLFQGGIQLINENKSSLREICSHADVWELTENVREFLVHEEA